MARETSPENFPLPPIERCTMVSVPAWSRRELWAQLKEARGSSNYIAAYNLSGATMTRDLYIRVYSALGLDIDAVIEQQAKHYGRERKRGPAGNTAKRKAKSAPASIPAKYLDAAAVLGQLGYEWRGEIHGWEKNKPAPIDDWD